MADHPASFNPEPRLLAVPRDELAHRVLRRLAAAEAQPSDDLPFRLTEFQRDAVRHAWRILQHRNGVIIADPVGVGKTYIAVGLIDASIKTGARSVLVAAPASLCSEWTRLVRQVAHARGLPFHPAASTGRSRLPQPRPGMVVVSHTKVGLGRWPLYIDMPDLVIADEAHAFRNPRTRRYAGLAWLCRRGRVVLVSATPVNNSLLDLYFLLRLFLTDAALADVGVPSLRDSFRLASSTRSAPEASTLDRAISAVLVRRTRVHLESAYGNDGPRFPDRSPPIPVRWSLPAARAMLSVVASLELQPFCMMPQSGPSSSRRATRDAGRAELLRYVLLKRLESGLAAFASSLSRLVSYFTAFGDALTSGLFLPPGQHSGPHGGQQLMFASLLLGPVPRGVDRRALAAGTDADLDRLGRLVEMVQHEVRVGDPKSRALRDLLAGPLAGRKVIVFSEFRTTAIDLFKGLAPDGHVALIHGGRAMVSAGQMARNDVVARFAPVANRAAVPPDHERIDLLIATDVLSEGLNLQDAEAVVSYDLPWNPVRLVQRLGRIERLGSAHPCIWCYNFLPDHDLDAMLGLLARIRRKLGAITLASGVQTLPASAFGEHTPIAHVGHVVRRIVAGDPSLYRDLERDATRLDQLDERLQAAIDLETRRASVPHDSAPGSQAPTSMSDPDSQVLMAANHGVFAWGVVAMRGNAPVWLVVDSAGIVRPDRDTVLEALLDAADAPGAASRMVSDDLDSRGSPLPRSCIPVTEPRILDYTRQGHVSTSDAARAVLDAAIRFLEDPSGQASAPSCGSEAERRVARAVMSLLAAIPGGPDASLCARADAVLVQLRRGARAGQARRLLDIVRAARNQPGAPGRSAERLLERLEAGLRQDVSSDDADRDRVVMLAVLALPQA